MGDDDAFVIAHEVGHALGFPHNMGEGAYDTESYRNAAFTKKWNSASLMDCPF
jgi:hypothetical protein